MGETYLLWSARSGGWLSNSSTYVSERKQARKCTRTEALDLVRTHARNGYNEFGLLPVSLTDLEDAL